MSHDEREQWMSTLVDAADWSDRHAAAEAMLDRVEQLERELAAARDALRVARSQLDESREAARGAYAELAAARAEPPRPTSLAMGRDGDVHAYESTDDYAKVPQEPGGFGYHVRSWTWHPATAKETSCRV